jgi:GAF domain-containing protein
VLPIVKNNQVIGVLDVDSEHLNFFNEVDEAGLKQILSLINF